MAMAHLVLDRLRRGQAFRWAPGGERADSRLQFVDLGSEARASGRRG